MGLRWKGAKVVWKRGEGASEGTLIRCYVCHDMPDDAPKSGRYESSGSGWPCSVFLIVIAYMGHSPGVKGVSWSFSRKRGGRIAKRAEFPNCSMQRKLSDFHDSLKPWIYSYCCV